MKRLLTGLLAILCALSAGAATLTPIQLLNPAGSTSGQAIVSTGSGTAPAWANVTASSLTPVGANTVIANATAATAAPTAISVPSCSAATNALLWTSNSGFSCNSAINASTLGGATFSAPGAIGGTTPGSGAFTTLSATGAITPSQTAGITATNTNNSASAGTVGEFICAQVTNGGSPTGCATNSNTPVSLTSNTPANVTSVSLGAGEWKCTASVVFNNGATTVTTQSTGSISTTSATMDTFFANYSPPNTGGLNAAFVVPSRRLLLSGTTTIYLVANNVFSTSTSAVYGRIECQRPR
jgi:hypothetical protein